MQQKLSSFLPLIYRFLPLIILVFAILLRSYHWQAYPFGFDQVQILENAERISQGDITLIGPRTGPANMFTGPLIYYVTAALMFAIPTPYTIVATALLLSLLTGMTLYLLTWRYFSQEKAIALLTLWAFSPFLIVLDRVPWNPNLTVMAAALAFFPTYFLLQQPKLQLRKHWFDLLLIAAGTFLGYQAHFSALMLPGLVTAAFLWRRRFPVLAFMAAWGGLAISIVPTILFDVRNEWLNWRGLQTLLSGHSASLMIDRLKELLRTATAVADNIGKVFFFDSNTALVISVGLAAVVLYTATVVLEKKKVSHASFFPIEWIVISTVLFSIYKLDKPAYYYLLQIPAVLLILDDVLHRIFQSRKALATAGIVFGLYSVFFTMTKFQKTDGMSLGNQLEIEQHIRFYDQQRIKVVLYDMESVHSLGMRYLLRDLPLHEGGHVIHVQYPYYQGTLTTHAVTDVGMWIDPRVRKDVHYLTKPTYIIGAPLDMQLYQVYETENELEGADIYKVWQNNQSQGELIVISKRQHSRVHDYIEPLIQKQFGGDKSWTTIVMNGVTQRGYIFPGHYVLYRHDPLLESNAQTIEGQLEFIH